MRFRAGTNPRTLLILIPNTPMKRILFSLLALFALAACSQNDVEEVSSDRHFKADPITVGFENEDTRIQLYNGKSAWNAGDRVSVFYRSFDNLKWVFTGEDGDRNGQLELEEGSIGKQVMNDIVVVYPYNENYLLTLSTRTIEAQVSAQQNYLLDSYDPASNLMIACNEDRNFVLKNAFGWLKVELTGEGQNVQNLTLRGNDGEILAGYVAVAFDDAAAEFIGTSLVEPDNDEEVGGSLDFNSSSESITLRCSGVELSSEACAFYFALVPQTFEKGITVEVKCRGYEPMVLSTDDAVEIKRNHIKPMATVEFEAEEGEGSEIPNNEIWYTATEQIWPNYVDDFDATLVDNYYNSATGEGILEFDGKLTRIPNDAFFYCSSLTSITIPDSVTTIGEAAFAYCESLTEFNGKFASEDGRCLIVDGILNSFAIGCGATEYTIPDSVTTIGQEAFAWCHSLTSITIPDSVTTIGPEAFAHCTNLISITIPDSVTTIGWDAFDCCSSLTSVYCEATTPPSLGRNIFDFNASGRKIYVPEESVHQYKIAAGWSDYADAIVGYDFENGVVVE